MSKVRMFRKILGTACLCALLVLSLVGCSVKELRDGCPAYVTILTDKFYETGHIAGKLFFDDEDNGLRSEDVEFAPLYGRGYEVPLNRDFARVSVVSGTDMERFDGSKMYVPYGQMAGLVYAFTDSFSVKGDLHVVETFPKKQFCLVQFMFGGSTVAPPRFRWRFRLKADCNALDLFTLQPVAGDYCCVVGPNSKGEWYGVIPRQMESNLTLEIYVPNSDSEIEGETEYVIDLGKYFRESGYDWEAENLPDVSVKVDFSAPEMFIEVASWVHDNTYRYIEW